MNNSFPEAWIPYDDDGRTAKQPHYRVRPDRVSGNELTAVFCVWCQVKSSVYGWTGGRTNGRPTVEMSEVITGWRSVVAVGLRFGWGWVAMTKYGNR